MRIYNISVVFTLILLAVSTARAEEKPHAELSAGKTLFVVETDEQSAVDSLNRVSGEIDKGFIYSDDDLGYKSDHQTKPSPFARQEQQDRH